MRAGEEALVDLGPGVTVNEIARRAGVSKGTFFRHFDSKDDLVSALVVEHHTRLLTVVREEYRRPGSARERLEGYMVRAADTIAAHRGYIEVANQLGAFGDEARAIMRKVDSAVGQLLTRVQGEHAVRPDIAAADVHAIILIATIAAAPGYAVRPDLWRRYLDVLLEGLAPSAPTELRVSLPDARAGGSAHPGLR